jgi:integrase
MFDTRFDTLSTIARGRSDHESLIMAVRKSRNKTTKPYPSFPLFLHQNGSWAKKIRGKLHYFGPHRDADGALKNYLSQAEALHSGRAPKSSPDSVQLRDVLNAFLSTKYALVETGELTARHVADYHRTCKTLAEHLGRSAPISSLEPQRFEALRSALAKNRGPVSLRNELTRIKSVFRYAVEAGLIDSIPRFGPGFRSPSHKSIRKARNAKGPLMFSAEDLRQIVAAADGQLRAMILLGASGGFGNSDVARLPVTAVSRDFKWINYARPKTEVPRRVPIWPETKAAIRWCLAHRPPAASPEFADLLFLTKSGRPWIRVVAGTAADGSFNPYNGTVAITDLIAQAFRRLLTKLEITGAGLSFYSLRRTLQTVGEESRDHVAVSAIMGHVPHARDMSAVYRQAISDDRLLHVSRTVHNWLWPQES